jgi:hypothetical protein
MALTQVTCKRDARAFGFTVAVAAVLTVIGIVGALMLWPSGRPDIHRLGGRVMLFEVEPSSQGPDYDGEAMVERLQRRLDDAGLGHVSVRQTDQGEIAFLIPNIASPPGETLVNPASLVRQLACGAGDLEFCILANQADDAEAIRDALELYRGADAEPALRRELEEAARAGQPPPGLRAPGEATAKRYTIRLAAGVSSVVTYRWLRTSKMEEDARGFGGPAFAEFMNANVGRAVQVQDPAAAHAKLWGGAVLFRRDGRRGAGEAEHFVLARNPEIDPKTGRMTSPVGRDHIVAVREEDDGAERGISIDLNPEGGRRLGELTGKNIPSVRDDGASLKRFLAIVVDGQVICAPWLNSRIEDAAVMRGQFTKAEVSCFIALFRAGPLPARLLTEPKAVREVPPGGR